MVEVSIIVPAYNQGRTIRRVISQIRASMLRITNDYEIIISEDGSSNNTLEIISELAAKDRRIRVLHTKHRLGKGRALNLGFESAVGKYLVFIDADYLGVPKFLSNMIANLKNNAVVIGSRYLAGTKVKRLPLRFVLSKGYIFLANLIFGLNLSDVHCGFKGVNRKVKPLLRKIKTTGYFWDTEFLVRVKSAGLTIKEIPIAWSEKLDSSALNPFA